MMLEILRWTLIAYIICGGLNALLHLLSTANTITVTHSQSTQRIIARATLIALQGFIPLLIAVWRFISSLPNAFKLEVLDWRFRAAWRREERQLFALEARRNLATYDPADEVAR